MRVYTSLKREDIAAGMWKFHESVSVEELMRLVISWKTYEPDKYLDLHVRECSKNQRAIVFQYQLDADDSGTDFNYRMTDQLKRKFGNKFLGDDKRSVLHVLSSHEDASIQIFNVGHKLKCRLGFNHQTQSFYGEICNEADATLHEFGLGSVIHQLKATKSFDELKKGLIFYGYKVPEDITLQLSTFKPLIFETKAAETL